MQFSKFNSDLSKGGHNLKRLFKAFMSLVMLFLIITPIQATEFYNVNVGYQGYEDGTWLDFAYGGALAGTEGGDALDSLEVHLVDAPYGAQIEYRVYTASGWTEWVSSYKSASNSGQDILGLQIRLKDFPNANVYYQSYRKDLGWGTWVSNGKTSGTLNASNPITGFRVQVDEIGVSYQSSIGGVNQILRHNGETQGKGSSLIETVSMTLNSAEADDKIEYRVYLRNEGWTNWAANGAVVGSTGKVVEALEARLVGLPQYSVQIQAQVNGEWWGYSYDGQTAGSIGNNQALTGYRVEIVQRVYVAPNSITSLPEDETAGGLTLSTSNNLSEVLEVSGWAFPAMGDLNGDGLMDVIAGSFDGTVQTYYQTSIGVFEQQTGDDNPLSIVLAPDLDGLYSFPTLGDFDNDGDLDLVLGYGDEDAYNAGLYFYKNSGSSTNPIFNLSDLNTNFLSVDRGIYSFLTTGDIDNDGDDDLILGSTNEPTNAIEIYINPGTSNTLISASNKLGTLPFTFTDIEYVVEESMYLYQMATIPYLGDFTGDGVIDFAYSGFNGTPIFLHKGAIVGGNVVFSYHSNSTEEISPFFGIEFDVPFASAADMDNDGDADFIIGDAGGTVRFYENN